MAEHAYVIVIKVQHGVNERPDWGLGNYNVTRNISNNGIYTLDCPDNEDELRQDLSNSIKPNSVVIYEDNPLNNPQKLRASFLASSKIPLQLFIHFGGTDLGGFDNDKIRDEFLEWSNVKIIPDHVKVFPFLGYDKRMQNNNEWISKIYEFRDWQKSWDGKDHQQFLDQFNTLDKAWESASKYFDTGLAMQELFEQLSPLALDAANGVDVTLSYSQIKVEVENLIKRAKLSIPTANSSNEFLDWFKQHLSITRTKEFGFTFSSSNSNENLVIAK